MLRGATPAAGCRLEPKSLRRSSMSCCRGLLVSMAIFTAFLRAFISIQLHSLESGKDKSS